MMLNLTIPFFGYNSSSLSKTETEEPIADDIKIKLEQKLVEADQLFLVNKYEEVVCLLEEFKVILILLHSSLLDLGILVFCLE